MFTGEMTKYAGTCELCRWAELKPWQRRLERATSLVLEVMAPRSGVFASLAVAGTIYAAMVGYSEPTWYERHLEAYAATGDLLELERMLRHVTA